MQYTRLSSNQTMMGKITRFTRQSQCIRSILPLRRFAMRHNSEEGWRNESANEIEPKFPKFPNLGRQKSTRAAL